MVGVVCVVVCECRCVGVMCVVVAWGGVVGVCVFVSWSLREMCVLRVRVGRVFLCVCIWFSG